MNTLIFLFNSEKLGTHVRHINFISRLIYSGIKSNKTYLYGTPFEVVVDHKPLLGLYKPRTKELTARVARHKSKLGGFDFKLVYEPGCTTPSDYGSRHPPPAKHYTKQEKEELGIEDAEEEMEFVVNEVEEI